MAESVESAIQQSHANIEVIVVDDGSTDNSVNLARGLQSSRVNVIATNHVGAAAARNAGLAIAQGDYLQFLDADDILAPRKLEIQLAGLADREPGFVASCSIKRFCKAVDDAWDCAPPQGSQFDPVGWMISIFRGRWIMPTTGWLTPREIVEKAGPWNEALLGLDDAEYFCRIVLNSRGVVHCAGAIAYYRTHDSVVWTSLSQERSRRSFEAELRAYELMIKDVGLFTKDAQYREAAIQLLQSFQYRAYCDAPDVFAQAEQLIEQMGGAATFPKGGPIFNQIARLVGWKAARRIRRWVAPLWPEWTA